MLVNTCGFVQAAKQDSIDELLAAAESGGQGRRRRLPGRAVRRGAGRRAARGRRCSASTTTREIGARLDDVLAGRSRPAHTRQGPPHAAAAHPGRAPAASSARPAVRRIPAARLDGSRRRRVPARGCPAAWSAPLKLASGCDRRCSFCAIPSFRGAFVSRRPPEILAEARWLAASGVRELVLVSENSTSYGKDLGDLRLLEELLPELAAVDGIERVRVSYLQPAELRPGLIEVIASTPGVAPYFDLSFQHASGRVLRRDAAVRRPRAVPRPARPDPGAEPAGRGPVQLHRRLPRRDRGRPGRARAVPERRPARRDRDLRLLRRGRHRGRVAARQAGPRRRSPAGSRSSPPWPTS